MDFINKLVGEKLKQTRIAKNLKQDDIAKIIDATKGSVANYESGKQAIYISDLFKIALKLNVKNIQLFLPTIDEVKKESPEFKISTSDASDYEKEILGKIVKKSREEIEKENK